MTVPNPTGYFTRKSTNPKPKGKKPSKKFVEGSQMGEKDQVATKGSLRR